MKMTVVETLPPEPSLLKFMLERRMPGQYRETKEVVHTHNAGMLFQKVLERMDAQAKGAPPLLESAPIIEVSPEPSVTSALPMRGHEDAKPLIDKDNADDV